jgi:ornithine decarboxylase
MRAIQVDASGFIQKPPGINSYIKRIAPSPLEQFLKTRPETPSLAVDLSEVKNKYRELREYFPEANIYYAVKANPSPEIVDTLAGLGSNFDAASLSEISLCMERGIHPGRI